MTLNLFLASLRNAAIIGVSVFLLVSSYGPANAQAQLGGKEGFKKLGGAYRTFQIEQCRKCLADFKSYMRRNCSDRHFGAEVHATCMRASATAREVRRKCEATYKC